MYDEPYLETCCRSALHRVALAEPHGRPAGEKDRRCLTRLAAMGLVCDDAGGLFQLTEAGADRHARDVLRRGN